MTASLERRIPGLTSGSGLDQGSGFCGDNAGARVWARGRGSRRLAGRLVRPAEPPALASRCAAGSLRSVPRLSVVLEWPLTSWKAPTSFVRHPVGCLLLPPEVRGRFSFLK